jgi:hypothetical protein
MKIYSYDIDYKDSQEVVELFYSNRLQTLIEVLNKKLERDHSLRLDDVEWNRIQSPTVFVHNPQYYHNVFIILVFNGDCTLSTHSKNKVSQTEINKVEELFSKDTINTVTQFNEYSFVLSPEKNKSVYYILFRSKRI